MRVIIVTFVISTSLFIYAHFSVAHHIDFVEYHVVDTSRCEYYPHNAEHPHREFMMHVWYPVEKKQHPLILFSHGLGHAYNGMTYNYLCSALATHGYVVASVSHTYACQTITFPSGDIARYTFPVPALHYQQGKHMFDVEVAIWVDDMICVLNECVRYNASENNVLYNKIDDSKIGVIGHSLGGSTALQLCRADSRVHAAINLDGPLYGENCMIPFVKPLMFIFGDFVCENQRHPLFLWRNYFNTFWLPALNLFIAACDCDVYTITIDGITHEFFSDVIPVFDIAVQPFLRDYNEAHVIITEYVLAFFDQYLKQQDAPLLREDVSEWPGVRIERNIY